jgi:hypothetical protein
MMESIKLGFLFCKFNTGLFVHPVLRGLAHLVCPNVFPSPIFSSSFARFHCANVRIQTINDDDSPGAVLSIHWEASWARCTPTILYSPRICTSALHKAATSSLKKIEHMQ